MESVSVHQLKKYFGKGETQVKALDGIDLSIEKASLPPLLVHPAPAKPLC